MGGELTGCDREFIIIMYDFLGLDLAVLSIAVLSLSLNCVTTIIRDLTIDWWMA